jgi:hypothetical protein
MDKKEVARKAAEVQDRIARFAQELMTEVYGNKGYPEWGTLFSTIEELGVQVGDAVCREVVRLSVSGQAGTPPEEPVCPTCGRHCDPRDPEPRVLMTRRGEVAWQEPQCHCKHCRRAFFPAVERLGHSC